MKSLTVAMMGRGGVNPEDSGGIIGGWRRSQQWLLLEKTAEQIISLRRNRAERQRVREEDSFIARLGDFPL